MCLQYLGTLVVVTAQYLSSTSSPLPPLPLLLLPSSLLSCRFDLPEQAAWLLSDHPQGLLGAFQVHLDGLIERLQSNSLPEQLRLQGGRSQILDHTSQCMLALARVAGCRDNYQQLTMSASTLLKTVVTLIRTLLDLRQGTPTGANLEGIVEGARHSIAFVHCLMDPHRAWQRNFMQ